MFQLILTLPAPFMLAVGLSGAEGQPIGVGVMVGVTVGVGVSIRRYSWGLSALPDEEILNPTAFFAKTLKE